MAGIAPNPLYPERTPTFYEAKRASGLPGERGPMRFEEGIATDTDVPMDFGVGVSQGLPDQARQAHNRKVDTKYADETMHQRAHAGSASWIEAPTVLAEFAEGSFSGYGEVHFERAFNDGTRQQRQAPTVVRW
jgi:hypothetical protein